MAEDGLKMIRDGPWTSQESLKMGRGSLKMSQGGPKTATCSQDGPKMVQDGFAEAIILAVLNGLA